MFISNRYLTVADIAFSTLDIIERVDYVTLGSRVINTTATLAAIIIGITTYVVTALQLFWLERGETIIINTIRFTVTLADFAGDCYHTGRKVRPVVIHTLNHLADTAFFKLAALV